MDIDIGEHSCLRGRKKKGPVCKDGAFLFYSIGAFYSLCIYGVPIFCLISIKDDCFVVVSEYFSFDMFGNGTGQDDFFEVTSFEDEGLGCVSVGDADNVLFDDGASVEILSNVMARRTNDFDAAFPSLMVGLGPYEGG